MVTTGFFKILKFLDDGKDVQGYQTRVLVESCMSDGFKCTLFLPPYMRKVSTSIDTGSKVFGVCDTVTGWGAALYCEDSDFDYHFDADVLINKTLTVDKAVTMKDTLDVTKDIRSKTGNIKAVLGDCIATTISLKTHTHQILVMAPQDAASIVASATTGSPVAFTSLYTNVPM